MTQMHMVMPKVLDEWLDQEEAIIVDVREPAEYRSEAIVQAINVPLSNVMSDTVLSPEDQEKKLVFYCQSGRRAKMACDILLKEQPEREVWNLAGGIQSWKAADLPVTMTDSKLLPLDRQVQVAIGLLLLVGITLGYYVDNRWFLLPFVLGLGLMNAGITGWCGLARVMARMPWNR